LRATDGVRLDGAGFFRGDSPAEKQEAKEKKGKRMIYIASPYSHPDASVREQRFRAVAAFQSVLISCGLTCYSPIVASHPLAELFQLPGDAEFWKRQNQAMMEACAQLYILHLPGWESSIGVGWEISLARSLGKPIDHFFNPL
jgi:hypothetical protein